MVNKKTILMILVAVIGASMIIGCGKSGDPETIIPRDVKTGKTFSNSNEMLTAVKAERPFEYDIVYEVTKDNPDAMKSYEKYNATTSDIFEKVKYVDKDGSVLSKEDFDKELAKMNLNGEYENLLTNYYQNIEKNDYKEAFGLIKPNSLYANIYGNRFEVFMNSQEQVKGIVRVTDVIPSEYKLVNEGEQTFLQITFRTTGFWIRQVLEGTPENVANNLEKKTTSSPTQNNQTNFGGDVNAPKMQWQYNASGKTIFRLINSDGKWFIYAQI